MRRFVQLTLLISSLLAFRLVAQPLRNQPVALLPTHEDQLPLQGHLAYFRDSSGVRTLSDVTRLSVGSAFQPVTAPVPNFGVIASTQTARPIWLRLRLKNPATGPQAWLGEIDFWCFDELQLFIVDTAGQIVSASPVIGWKTPAAQRPLHHRYYWFPFSVAGGQSVTVYLRVLKHRGTQIIPLQLVRQSAYESTVQKSYLFWGGILCTLTFVALMSLIFFLNTFNRIYLKYIFCLLGLVGFFVINNGFLNQFAFDQQFWLPRQNVYFLFPLILFYSQLIFVRSFLPLRHTPVHRLHTIGTVVLGCGLLCLLALTIEWITPLPPMIEQTLSLMFALLYWLPMPIIVAYVGVSIIGKYYVREGWLYLVAIAPFYTLNLGQVFANFGLIPTYEPLVHFAYYAPAALFEVLVLTVGLAYRYKIDRDQTEHLLNEQTVQQQRTLEAEVQTLALKNSLLAEKARIARDLHDNVGAHLAFVVTNLTHISDQAEKQPVLNARQLSGQLRTVVNYTREAVKLLRETIWAIHQENFTVEEFAERLDQYINRYVYDTNGLHVDLQLTGSQTQRLSSTQVLNLFRIVQEALNNVIKHAQATQASVQLHVHTDGRIELRIRDNGRGFIWSDAAASERHYGLQNMQTRAQELGGTFRVLADEGTVIEVAV